MYAVGFVQLDLDLKIYTLEKDNFADLAHFYYSVLEMSQVLVSELISPGLVNKTDLLVY